MAAVRVAAAAVLLAVVMAAVVAPAWAIIAPSITADDIRIDFNTLEPKLDESGGTVIAVNAKAFPGLVDSGVAFNLVTLKPQGVLNSHFHPRATEVVYCIKGTLRACFAEENDGRTFCADLNAGNVYYYPEDSIHYTQNIGGDEAAFLAVFNDEDPGTSFLPQRLFALPVEGLTAGFGVGAGRLASLAKNFQDPPALGLVTPAANLSDAVILTP